MSVPNNYWLPAIRLVLWRASTFHHWLMLWAILSPIVGVLPALIVLPRSAGGVPWEFLACLCIGMLWPLIVCEVNQRRNRFYQDSFAWLLFLGLAACNNFPTDTTCQDSVEVASSSRTVLCSRGARAEVITCPQSETAEAGDLHICVVCRCSQSNPTEGIVPIEPDAQEGI
jgi:hypothetical protein